MRCEILFTSDDHSKIATSHKFGKGRSLYYLIRNFNIQCHCSKLFTMVISKAYWSVQNVAKFYQKMMGTKKKKNVF